VKEELQLQLGSYSGLPSLIQGMKFSRPFKNTTGPINHSEKECVEEIQQQHTQLRNPILLVLIIHNETEAFVQAILRMKKKQ